jgi:hypothetical protein
MAGKGCAVAKMQSTVVIARPVEEVFGFVLAIDESAPRIDPCVHVGSVIKTPDGPPGPGTTFRFRQQNLGKTRETLTRFIAVEPNRKIEFEAEIGPMRPQCDLTFTPTDRGDEGDVSRRLHSFRPVQMAVAACQP